MTSSASTTGASASAASAAKHKANKIARSGSLNTLFSDNADIAANTDPSVESWANEVIDALKTLPKAKPSSPKISQSEGVIPQKQTQYNPGGFIGSSSSSLSNSPTKSFSGLSETVNKQSDRVTTSSSSSSDAKKKKKASPLDGVAESLTWAPGSSGELDKFEKKANAASKALSADGALKGGGLANSASVTSSNGKRDGSRSGGNSNENKTSSKGKNMNYDTKTDLRGRAPTDDLIVTDPVDNIGSIVSSSKTTTDSTSSPRIAYHEQAHKPVPEIVVKSVDYVKSQGLPVPDMTLQKAEFEKENLKVHLCNAVYEAYSASYLTTRKHMMAVKSEGFNLTWVNCEMASFIHMRESKNFLINPKGDGMIIQSLDVLDFSVIHLSAFERSSKKHKDLLWTKPADLKSAWHNIDPVKKTANILDNLNNPKNPKAKKIVWTEEAKQTVVVMPFLGGAMGAGHSELGNRFEYLKACFWSFYEFCPNIVAGVARQEDVDWGMKESGLPFYDMILVENLPKSAGLPVGLTQQIKKRLVSGEYDFEYIFFTESDQILISRELPLMHDHLKKWPDRMILPHRLMPYSDRVIQEVHKRDISDITKSPQGKAAKEKVANGLAIGPNDWMEQSCCMQRQNCVERKTWKPIASPSVPIINYHGLYVPLGNVNFLAESYRFCEMSPYKDICP